MPTRDSSIDREIDGRWVSSSVSREEKLHFTNSGVKTIGVPESYVHSKVRHSEHGKKLEKQTALQDEDEEQMLIDQAGVK
ncbi:hypothetical protein ACLKA6_016250 [Drosophila palustris]